MKSPLNDIIHPLYDITHPLYDITRTRPILGPTQSTQDPLEPHRDFEKASDML